MRPLEFKPFYELSDDIISHLLDGHIVQVRGAPESGRSALLNLVAERTRIVADLAPVVIRPDTAVADIETIIEKVLDDIAKRGAAAILIDDFGDLLRSHYGGIWQTRLNSLCVDGEQARQIGVLLICKHGENLSRTGIVGSPLADAANVTFAMPLLSRDEVLKQLETTGTDLETARRAIELYGCHLGLLAEAFRTSAISVPRRRLETSLLRAVANLPFDGSSRLLDLERRQMRGHDGLARLPAPANTWRQTRNEVRSQTISQCGTRGL